MSAKRNLWLITMGLLMLAGTNLPAATISFSGYTWQVRGSARGGPGPNNWEPGNVLVDTNGYLHLRLTQRNGEWYCGEVYSEARLGFGRYEFWIVGPLDMVDRNVVLGLFNYPTRDVGTDGTHEIDIEFARWGAASAPVGNYTVWPATNSVKRQTKSFPIALDGEISKHSFTWRPTEVVFQSDQGAQAGTSRVLADWLYRPANPATWISQRPMPVHINLWCFAGKPPSNGQEVEFIIRAFKFTPF